MRTAISLPMLRRMPRDRLITLPSMEVQVWARGLAARGRWRALQWSSLICTLARGPRHGTDGRVHMGQSFPQAKSGLLFLLMCAFLFAGGISSSSGFRSGTPGPSSVSTDGMRAGLSGERAAGFLSEEQAAQAARRHN